MTSYYPETVVFVLDACEDPGMDPAKHASRLELLKQSIGLFAQVKSRVNAGHKYGLAVVRDTVQWEGPGVSASPEGLVAALRGVQPRAPAPAAAASAAPPPPPPLDLGAVVALVQPLAVAEEADGGKVRALLVYGRSTVAPVWTTRDLPGEQLCMDVLFVHDRAAATAAAEAAWPHGCAHPQEVFSWLEENVDVLSGRCGHSAYIFEAGSLFAKKVPNLMISLVAHPCQRPPQRALRTAPLDLAAMPPQPTAATPAASAFTSPSSTATPATAPTPPLDSSAFPLLPGSSPPIFAAAASPAAGTTGPGSAWSTPRSGAPDAVSLQTHHPGIATTQAGAGGGAGGPTYFISAMAPPYAVAVPPPAMQSTPRSAAAGVTLTSMSDQPPAPPAVAPPSYPPPSGAAAHAAPGYATHTDGTAVSALAGLSLNPTYTQQPKPAYMQQLNPAYPQQPNPAYPQQPNAGGGALGTWPAPWHVDAGQSLAGSAAGAGVGVSTAPLHAHVPPSAYGGSAHAAQSGWSLPPPPPPPAAGAPPSASYIPHGAYPGAGT